MISMQEEAQGQFLLHAASETLNPKWIGRLASAPRDASSCGKTISIPQPAGTDGLSTVQNAIERGCTGGETPYRCSTQKRAARVSRWHWAKLTVVENGWSTRSSASTGAVQHLLALKTTRS